jgi:peptidoglycan/LPS O-acetylase OafA/YrhL
LSGFLILQSWERCPQVVNFLRKRVLRIYPAFVVASLISALIVGPLGAHATNYFTAFDWGAYAKSIALLGSPEVPKTFAGRPYPDVNGPLWTVGYEFRCYLLCAVLAVSVGIFGSAKRWLWLVAAITVLTVSLALLNPSDG